MDGWGEEAYYCGMYSQEHSPTNVTSVHLVMGCPDARGGIKIV